MEKILKERTKTYSALFDDIGVGNSLHVSTDAYDFNAVRTETQRQNDLPEPNEEQFLTHIQNNIS